MERLLLSLSIVFSLPAIAQSNDTSFVSKKFSADTIRYVIDDWTRELSVKHPGFYRYTSRAEFDHYIDSIKSTITDSLDIHQTYLKIKPIITKVHCLHTGIQLPKDYSNYLNTQPNLLPLQVFYENGKMFVVKDHTSANQVMPGDEIISINGKKISSIVPPLLELIPSDGYNLTMKLKALYHQFPTWYRLLDPASNFSLVLRRNDSILQAEVKGAKLEDIAKDGFLKEPRPKNALEFDIVNDVGVLKIHSFSNSAIKEAKQNFKEFVSATFNELESRKIKNLVVDLRDNTGGSDGNAVYLSRQFFDKPFRYWDRIEVTEAIARQIRGIKLKLFYRKPVQKDSMWLWQKARLQRDFDYYEMQKPVKAPFKGKVYLLINGFCMSSCSDVASVLSYNKKAILIGEETGGGYQGNTSGIMPESTVAPFNFLVTIPLQKYVNYVDHSKNFGRGAMPDVPVPITIDDVITGNDVQMKAVMEMIRKGG